MSTPPEIHTRPFAPDAIRALTACGIHPLLAQIYAARGVTDAEQLSHALEKLHPHGHIAG
jgi:single-stranded-DNA-specific exonuclease